MNGTSGYEEAVKKIEYLCPVCLRKLQAAIDFDIAERYDKLSDLGDERCGELAQKIWDVVGKKN